MSGRNTSPEATIAFVFILVVGGGILRLSATLGADFLPTLISVVWSAVILVSVMLGLRFRNSYEPANWLAWTSGSLVAIWPGWWRTLESIAANGGKSRSLFPADNGGFGYPRAYQLPFDQDIWWNSWWFYGFTELLLVGLFLTAMARGAWRWRH